MEQHHKERTRVGNFVGRWAHNTKLTGVLGVGLLLCVTVIVVSVLLPFSSADFDGKKAVAAVMASADVKAALQGDTITEVLITGVFDYETEATITTSTGRTYKVLIDNKGNIVAINPGTPRLSHTFFPLFTSPHYSSFFEQGCPVALNEDEKVRLIEVAKNSDPIRVLLEQGATISGLSIAYAKTTTVFDMKTKTWTAIVHEKLAQVLIKSSDQSHVFLIDFAEGTTYASFDEFCRSKGIPYP